MTTQVYLTGKPDAGRVVTKLLLCEIDTFHVGMPLDYDPASDDYGYSATVVHAIAYEDITLAAQGMVLCLVSGSEFPKASVVDDANAPFTVTADIDESARQNGIILR